MYRSHFTHVSCLIFVKSEYNITYTEHSRTLGHSRTCSLALFLSLSFSLSLSLSLSLCERKCVCVRACFCLYLCVCVCVCVCQCVCDFVHTRKKTRNHAHVHKVANVTHMYTKTCHNARTQTHVTTRALQSVMGTMFAVGVLFVTLCSPLLCCSVLQCVVLQLECRL